MPHQSSGAIGILLNAHHILERGIGGPHFGEQQICKANDRREHVVEVMGKARRELPNSLHLLALRQLRFE